MIPETWIYGASAATSLAISARWNWWRLPQDGLPVLMYHKVGTPPPHSQLKGLWVSTKAFRRQMEYLKKKEYTALGFSELVQAHRKGNSLPKRSVLVTFDDGYENNYTEAYPILKELKMKGNIFLVVETLDHHNSWHNPDSEPWIRMLTWSQVHEMKKSGWMEFGSHTMRHRNLSQTPLEEAKWEFSESKKRLEERLDEEMSCFAYPYGAGAYHPPLREAALQCGYVLDFGIRQGKTPWPHDPKAGPLKRLYIRGDDYAFDFYLNLTRGKARL
ncbi:MAG: polysaccharide deacetylase family protein [Elusimicrobia bacterium]|nr:polysaccharide deacetylase family protein [Elusimicrobiota bacterium]